MQQEYLDLLEDYPSLFNRLLEKGIVKCDDTGKLKQIELNVQKDYFELILPQKWFNYSLEEKKFFLIHPLLHIIFDHHKRNVVKDEFQIALDIVVNNILVNYMHFSKDILKKYELYSYDLLKEKYPQYHILKNQNVEYYTRFLEENKSLLEDIKSPENSYQKPDKNEDKKDPAEGEQGDEDDDDSEGNCGHCDNHGAMIQNAGQYKNDYVDNFMKNLEQELLDVQDLNSYGLVRPADEVEHRKFMKTNHVQWKKYFDMCFKKVYRKELVKNTQTWKMRDRKYHLLNKSYILPGNFDTPEYDFTVKVWIFQDVSESCAPFANYFRSLIDSIRIPENITVEYFDFHSVVIPNPNRKINYRYGGTNFSKIQEYVDQNGKYVYPWILTDGIGGPCQPLHPENWFWFLFGKQATSFFIPKESQFFSINNIEKNNS